MSSPLLDEIRERRGLAYYLSCSADVSELAGQFVIEASTAPEHAEEFLIEVKRLLAAQAEAVEAVDLERAKNQIAVRRLRASERPSRRLEDAALDLLSLGRIRRRAELAERTEAITASDVRRAFAQMLESREAVAIAGKIRKGILERAREIFASR
jgi:predicted Zn-dependent peptidase